MKELLAKIPRFFDRIFERFSLRGIFFSSFIALVTVHSLYLQKVPGFQMDEGLFGDTANRLASGESIPFLQGMVSYTTWIISYVPAVLFWLFGVSAAVYRVSGVIETVAGVLLISLALFILKQKKAAAILPGLIAFFPALVINQRWVVEASTFFAFCAGCVALGLALKAVEGPGVGFKSPRFWGSTLLIVLGVTAGIHSHVVFIAPVLALYLCLFVSGKIETIPSRFIVACICVLQIPFFLKIAQLEASSSRLQSTALLGVDLLILLASIFPGALNFIRARWRVRLLAMLAIPGVVLLIPFTLFLEGNWLAMFSVGFLDYPQFLGIGFIPVGLTVYFILKSGWRPQFSPAYCFLPLSLFFVYGMVIKAGPRYFEVAFLFVATCFAWAIARLKRKQALLIGVLWVLQGSLILGLNYFKPSVEERQIDRTFHLWRWRDNSSGFLPKVRLLKRLAAEGCGYSNIDFRVRDDNTHGAFRVLKINEWPPFQPPCRIGQRVRIQSRLNFDEVDEPQKGRYIEGPYILIDTTHLE